MTHNTPGLQQYSYISTDNNNCTLQTNYKVTRDSDSNSNGIYFSTFQAIIVWTRWDHRSCRCGPPPLGQTSLCSLHSAWIKLLCRDQILSEAFLCNTVELNWRHKLIEVLVRKGKWTTFAKNSLTLQMSTPLRFKIAWTHYKTFQST